MLRLQAIAILRRLLRFSLLGAAPLLHSDAAALLMAQQPPAAAAAAGAAGDAQQQPQQQQLRQLLRAPERRPEADQLQALMPQVKPLGFRV